MQGALKIAWKVSAPPPSVHPAAPHGPPAHGRAGARPHAQPATGHGERLGNLGSHWPSSHTWLERAALTDPWPGVPGGRPGQTPPGPNWPHQTKLLSPHLQKRAGCADPAWRWARGPSRTLGLRFLAPACMPALYRELPIPALGATAHVAALPAAHPHPVH